MVIFHSYVSLPEGNTTAFSSMSGFPAGPWFEITNQQWDITLLVNIQKTMERSTIFKWVNQLFRLGHVQ